MRHWLVRAGLAAVVGAGLCESVWAQATGPGRDLWSARTVGIPDDPRAPRVLIGIWDSGVDTTLFRARLARGRNGQALIRGYDAFKHRHDTPMEPLPEALLARRDELNAVIQALDDLDTGVESPATRAYEARIATMAAGERAAAEADVGRWSGYIHGTSVADVAVRDNGRAALVIARMEWWKGNPPVPCWTRELADREAASIGDLLRFLVESGARVVNMSWGRHERSYLRALAQCAPDRPEPERKALARYTVDTIRAVLRTGMAAAPQVLFVGAAGNEGISMTESNPATLLSLPNFVLVGAVGQDGSDGLWDGIGREPVDQIGDGARGLRKIRGSEEIRCRLNLG